MSELSPQAQKLIEEEVLKVRRTFDPNTVRDTSFPEQDKFVQDRSQFLAALCTRRAGKSSGLALRYHRTMLEYPGSMSRYIALTRDSAKDIMWPVLQDMNDRFNLGATLTESNLTMTLTNGSKLRLYGADMKNFIRRLRGTKSPAVAIDEAQEFGPHITNLIDDILTPGIADYDNSWIALTGTPGPIPRGLFYDITHKGIGEYSIHRWSLYQNPYLPNAQQFVDKLKKKKQWDDTNPTFLREYMGRWVLDLESLWIRWYKEKNHYNELPAHNWVYILGVDIGFNDADALAVIAWSESTRKTYLVEEVITEGQDITTLTKQITRMMDKYDIAKMVMDEGGLGKKIAEELRRRKHIPIHPADKARKMENAAFLNEELRLGNFKAREGSRFVQDSFQVQVDHEKTTPDKIVLKSGFHSDIIDAVLYAFKESPAFTYQKQEDKPKWGTKKWAHNETNEMEQAAEEYFSSLETESQY
ncbi:MAG: hypothetical protein IPL34_20175 [Thiofilum sp.]|uniref:hypothetical protein n=1 Tax=Thiofilum sp. TaxID=2212733 RepID=UPI0025F00785|nr:hypothetical protein [Thiofilum sp.]MBK8455599.1 hypothetical protein [Thiofilum sp.]